MADNSTLPVSVGTEVFANDDIGSVKYPRAKLSLGADGSATDALGGAGSVSAAVQRMTLASDDPAVTLLTALSAKLSWAFDVAATPTVTNGAYSAGDIMGGLIDFPALARANDELIVITGVQVISKAAVTPSLTLVLFNADPGSTTTTDNAAYSLNAADAFKVVKAIPISALYDHGTPNSWSAEGLNIVAAPYSGARNLKGLLIDATGVTLTSTSDIQVRLRGLGA
jgi:hypothetical protein